MKGMNETPQPPKPPRRGSFCERCSTRGPRFADGEPLDLRISPDSDGTLKPLCFRCRASLKIEGLERRKAEVEKKLKELKDKPVVVPEVLPEEDQIHLRGMGVTW